MTNEALGSDKRQQVVDLRRAGMSVAEISAKTGLAKPTVYAYARGNKPEKKANGVASKTNGGSLSITVQGDGTFLVKVPADRLTAVARALS